MKTLNVGKILFLLMIVMGCHHVVMSITLTII